MTAAMPQPEKMTARKAIENSKITVFYRSVIHLQTRGQRLGQAVWNAAEAMFPEAVEGIRSTDLDPFYNDAAVTEFLARVFEHLAAS